MTTAWSRERRAIPVSAEELTGPFPPISVLSGEPADAVIDVQYWLKPSTVRRVAFVILWLIPIVGESIHMLIWGSPIHVDLPSTKSERRVMGASRVAAAALSVVGAFLLLLGWITVFGAPLLGALGLVAGVVSIGVGVRLLNLSRPVTPGRDGLELLAHPRFIKAWIP